MYEVRFEMDCDTSVPHFHGELEIAYILSGQVAVMTQGVNYKLKAEDIVIFNSYQYHELYRPAGSHMLSAYFPISFLQQLKVENINCSSGLMAARNEEFQRLRSAFAALFWDFRQGEENRRLYIMGDLYALFALLKQDFEDPESKDVTSDAKWLADVLHYVGGHFTEQISLQTVAERFYLSQSHLSRKFKEQMGIGFSEYVRKLRMEKAAAQLKYTSRPITDIAMDCGFSYANTLISYMRKYYGCTPHEFRSREIRQDVIQKEIEFTGDSYNSLLWHVPAEKIQQGVCGSKIETIRVDVSLNEKEEKQLCRTDIFNVHRAINLTHDNVRRSVQRIKKELGVEYIRITGIIEDNMNVYFERSDGSAVINFTNIDMVLDFCVSLGLKLWLEFSYTPEMLISGQKNYMYMGGACINLPHNMEKWGYFVRKLMEHLAERYRGHVDEWIFSGHYALYYYYGVYTLEEYMRYYECTYRTIRSVFPEIRIAAFGIELETVSESDETALFRLLKECAERECMPDLLDFQYLNADFDSFDLDYFMCNVHEQKHEPIMLNFAPDQLSRKTAIVRKILERMDLGHLKLIITTWGLNVWQRNPGNDTCFAAAYILKNIFENADDLDGIIYGNLIDYGDMPTEDLQVFHGGFGLICSPDIPKASYFAFDFIHRIEGIPVKKGKGYIVTRSRDENCVNILLYHYCHYIKSRHIGRLLSTEEQKNFDRYYEYEKNGLLSVIISLTDMQEGSYKMEQFTVNQEHGSSFDLWLKMGAPRTFTKYQADYLERLSMPGYTYETLSVGENGLITVSALLQPHEIRLITLKEI